MSLTLLSLCCWKSHTSGLLSWRNWDEALLEEFIRAWWGGYLKRIHPRNPRITVWIRMRDVLLLQKFYQVREFRIYGKNITYSFSKRYSREWFLLITGKRGSLVTVLNYLIQQMVKIIYIVENSISVPQSVTVGAFHLVKISGISGSACKWNTFRRFVPQENSQKKWKI